MPDALDKLRAGVDKRNKKLAAHRLGGRELDVVVRAWTEGNTEAGTMGSWADAFTISPRPSVRMGDVFRSYDGTPVKVGDAEVSGISRTYTEDQLRGAPGTPMRVWKIGTEHFSLVSLKAEPTEYVAVLVREAE